MKTVTWYYRITKSYTTKTAAWITADQLSYLGPLGGKYTITKLGRRSFEMSAIVSSAAVESGEVALIVGSKEYGIQSIVVEEEKKAS